MSKEAQLKPIPLTPTDKTFQFPAEIESAKGREIQGDVDFEWLPTEPGEYIVGHVQKINVMKAFGGLAVVFALDNGEKCLLKKGGVVFEEMFTDLAIQKNDYIAVMYMGESAAKDGQNPARLWRIKKLDV
jgi:hypothetical protein